MTTLVMFLFKSVVTDFFSLQISYMFDSCSKALLQTFSLSKFHTCLIHVQKCCYRTFSLSKFHVFDSWCVISYWSEAQVDFLYMVVGLQQRGFVAEDELTWSIRTCPAIAIITLSRDFNHISYLN